MTSYVRGRKEAKARTREPFLFWVWSRCNSVAMTQREDEEIGKAFNGVNHFGEVV